MTGTHTAEAGSGRRGWRWCFGVRHKYGEVGEAGEGVLEHLFGLDTGEVGEAGEGVLAISLRRSTAKRLVVGGFGGSGQVGEGISYSPCVYILLPFLLSTVKERGKDPHQLIRKEKDSKTGNKEGKEILI